MKIMKKIYVLLFCLSSLVGLNSCSSWIEEDTDGQMLDTTVGQSANDVDAWVTGVYSKWIYDMFCWGYFPRVLEFDADYISGPDWLFGTFGAGNFQGESDVTDALWKGCYGLIARANNAERRIRAMASVDEAVKNNGIGEVKFQKAFAYFMLVRAYGEVPIQPETAEFDKNQPRQSVADVYAYITTQLEEAAALMYKNTDNAYQKGHVCAGSAAGLLAKVYATMASAALPAGTQVVVRTGAPYYTDANGERQYADLVSKTIQKKTVKGYEQMDSKTLYTKAKDWADRVLTGKYGDYELLPYNQLWKKSFATASEFMFSVGSVSGDATYKIMVHSQYEGYMTAPGSEFIQSGGWVGCTRHWYDLFDHDDLRIVEGVKHRWRVSTQQASGTGFYYPYTNEYRILAEGRDLEGNWVQDPSGIYADGLSYYYSKDAQCLAFTTKYMDVTNDAIDNADANWPFLRLADVVLVYAEAANELGSGESDAVALNTALAYLNMVRARSNATAGTLATLDTKLKMRSAIIEERAKELACEADRRWDLLRWGIYLDAMNAVGSDDAGVQKSRLERCLLFPLPAQELNTNKAITANNPGWN
ncbi:MAG: RagB/SusD family nutrient uptake outer membrane protein [Prevotella sp.]|nr:RagB/SusD family nutrient uptake outer membrane protein [Prevotella sp.]